MGLTLHQTEVKNQALDILKVNKRLVIKGSAGVGKTFTVNELVKSLAVNIPSFAEIFIAAPTNKAVAVLADKIDLKDSVLSKKKISLTTVSSALKIKKVISDTGKSEFKPSDTVKFPPLRGVKLMIVDEASMLPLQHVVWLEEYANKNGTTLIFLGDDKQLNPVGELNSTVFIGQPFVFATRKEAEQFDENNSQLSYISELDKCFVAFKPYPEVELTEIIRQGEGNPIIDLSRDLSMIQSFEPKLINGKGFIYTLNREKIIEELVKSNGSDNYKYLSWTNDDVDEMNKEVRNRIYNDPKKVELEETLIFDKPYGEFYTNQEIKVNTLDIDDVTFKIITFEKGANITTELVNVKCYIINGKQVDPYNSGQLQWKGIFVVHEDAEEQMQNVEKFLKLKATKRDIRWKSFEIFNDNFAVLKPNHALTIHKSQGSTFKHTIINVQSINQNPNLAEKERMLYTAITRSSDVLILYKA